MPVPRDRPQPGPGAPLTAEREQYRRLMAQGLNNHQACLLIGVDPTTGNLLAAGQSQRSVAAQLGRSPSTISREIRRNTSGAGNYRPFGAHRKALARRPRPRSGKLAHDNDLRDFVQDRLEQRWSPQQICHALPTEFPGQPERHLVHETIYQALYVQGRGELRRELARALRTGRARRKPHRRGDARRQGCIVDASVMISERAAEADDRAVPGHWEGDCATRSRTSGVNSPWEVW